MSLLLSEGHPHAEQYTLAHLWSEARHARKRINEKILTEGLLLRAVIGEVFDSEGGGRILRKLLKRLEDYG